MASVRMMLVTPDGALFERVHGFVYARHEVRLLPKRVDEFRPLVAVRREQPDVLLVDGYSSGDVGINIVRRIAALRLRTRTLVLHNSVTDARIAHVLQCGAAGCLSRESNASDVIRAVQAVHRGELWASRKVLADVLNLMRGHSSTEPDDQSQPELSKREREIVAWMRKGMTNKEIARTLGISDMTVKTHAHNIFHKLDVSGRRLLGALPVLQQ